MSERRVNVDKEAEGKIPISWRKGREQLGVEIRRCVRERSPQFVNLSAAKHTVITTTLHEFVYDRIYAGTRLPVTFMDGSKPPPFPLGCFEPLESLPEQKHLPQLSLGLMSLRHPELDFLVDLYVNRNLQISGDLSMADEEQHSFENCVEALGDTALREGGVISVFHTGLEPMVVGFYRGVVHVLQTRRREQLPRMLFIYPQLLIGRPTKTELTPNSPGARRESYLTVSPWY